MTSPATDDGCERSCVDNPSVCKEDGCNVHCDKLKDESQPDSTLSSPEVFPELSPNRAFLSEDHRNCMYDAWLSACEDWNRKRLKWLCKIARLKGNDESRIIETAFSFPLRKRGLEESGFESKLNNNSIVFAKPTDVSSFSHSCGNELQEQFWLASQTNENVEFKYHKLQLKGDYDHSYAESKSDTINLEQSYAYVLDFPDHFSELRRAEGGTEGVQTTNFDVWEEWYRMERLYLHRTLYNDGLPNWYEDLLEEEEHRYNQGQSMFSSFAEAQAEHHKLSTSFDSDDDPAIIQSEANLYFEDGNDDDCDDLTVQEMYLYQLTDPYFWLGRCQSYC